jgi:hypothetical protein
MINLISAEIAIIVFSCAMGFMGYAMISFPEKHKEIFYIISFALFLILNALMIRSILQ